MVQRNVSEGGAGLVPCSARCSAPFNMFPPPLPFPGTHGSIFCRRCLPRRLPVVAAAGVLDAERDGGLRRTVQSAIPLRWRPQLGMRSRLHRCAHVIKIWWEGNGWWTCGVLLDLSLPRPVTGLSLSLSHQLPFPLPPPPSPHQHLQARTAASVTRASSWTPSRAAPARPPAATSRSCSPTASSSSPLCWPPSLSPVRDGRQCFVGEIGSKRGGVGDAVFSSDVHGCSIVLGEVSKLIATACDCRRHFFPEIPCCSHVVTLPSPSFLYHPLPADAMLSSTVTVLTILQTLRAVGRMNADELPSSLLQVYRWIAIITFDVSVLEPGCSIDSGSPPFCAVGLGLSLCFALGRVHERTHATSRHNHSPCAFPLFLGFSVGRLCGRLCGQHSGGGAGGGAGRVLPSVLPWVPRPVEAAVLQEPDPARPHRPCSHGSLRLLAVCLHVMSVCLPAMEVCVVERALCDSFGEALIA